MALVAGVLAVLPGAAAAGSENPRLSRPAGVLGRREAEAPFVCAHVALGGAFARDQGLPGYGATVIFHPAAAAGFLDFLYAWNAGMVLQADRLSLGDGGRVLSVDLIMRRYLQARGDGPYPPLPFLGVGLGASSAWPGPAESASGLKYWSLLLEAGQETHVSRRVLVVVKGQVRLLRQSGADWSTWSVQAGLGLPFPW